MNIFSKIAQNTIIHLVGKFLGLILGVVSVAIMTRYLGQEGFGYYTTAAAFTMFLATLFDFGFALTTVQMVADSKRDFQQTINNLMSFRFLLSLAYLILCVSIIWAFPYSLIIKFGVLIICFSFFFSTMTASLTSVFQQKMKMLNVTIAEVSGKLVLVLLIGFFAYYGFNIYWIFGAITLEAVVTFFVLYNFSKKFFVWKFVYNKEAWLEIFKKTWPIALSISFNLIYLRMDTIILSLTRSQTEVGLYGATYRIVDVLTMLPAVFMGIVLPVVTKYFLEHDYKNLYSLLRKSFDVLMVFAVPIVVGTFIVAKPFMIFIAGADFALSGEILKVLIIGSAAIFVTSLSGYVVVGIHKQKQMVWGYLTTALLTLVGYLIFIPKFGYFGAAWMTVFSEILVMIWTTSLVYSSIKFFPSLKIFLKTIPAAMVMAFVLYALKDLYIIWLLLIACLVYFPVLFILGGIKKQTILDLIRIRENK